MPASDFTWDRHHPRAASARATVAGGALVAGLASFLVLVAHPALAEPPAQLSPVGGASGATIEVDLTDQNGAEAILGIPAVIPVALVAFPGEALSAMPADLGEAALFGTLRHGGPDGIVTIIVDPRPDGTERVYVDENDDEDLANDPVHVWEGDFGVGELGEALLPRLTVECEIACDDGTIVPIRLELRRYDRQRVKGRMAAVALRNGVLAAIDTYRQGELTIGDSHMAIAVVPTALAGRYTLFSHPSNALVIDLNGDGVLDGRPLRSPERFRLSSAFAIGGHAYRVTETSCDGRHLTIAEIDPKRTARPRPRGGGPLPGEPAPEFELTTIDGDTLSLEAYRGSVVLLDFWATWCRPCRYEIPYVKQAYERYHDQGFDVIGISLDMTANVVASFTASNGMPWPQILQPRGAMTPLKAAYGVNAIPAAFLIDADGRLVASGLRGEQLLRAIGEIVANGGRQSG